ncbi:MAG TPA: outer membrane beta-barrel protein [Gemmatimonadales bacterium]|nr:outer membrane beta-barrel protein [Gemmatimonadales bacterium]
MKRISLSALAVAAALCAAMPLRAQVIPASEGFRFGLGVGATQPLGDYGDFDKMGINLLGIFETPFASSPLYLRIDGIYSSTAHEGTGATGSTSILGGNASVLYHFSAPNAQARPYALGGLGIYNVDGGSDSQTKIGLGLGGGVTFSIGGLNAFAEARYISVKTDGASTSFVPVTIGLLFGY